LDKDDFVWGKRLRMHNVHWFILIVKRC
jgi:hypothetical protein